MLTACIKTGINLPVEGNLCVRIMIEPPNESFDDLRNTIETAENEVHA